MRNCRRKTEVVLLVAFNALAASAQSAAHFEVASVRPSAPGGTEKYLSLSGGLFSVQGQSLREMIYGGFGVRSFEISGIPPWVASARYDIVARNRRTAAGTTHEFPGAAAA